MRRRLSRGEVAAGFVTAFVVGVALFALENWTLGYVIHDVFGGPELTFMQTAVTLILAHVIFGGSHMARG
jgi:hypothetical protein